MRNHTLEFDVVRVARFAASRSRWKIFSVMPGLFRISRKLDRLIRRLEASEERFSPSSLNRLARSLHGVQSQFHSPVFRLVSMRIERSNLRLAEYAENAYKAAHPAFPNLAILPRK